jgi:hypothetical protein
MEVCLCKQGAHDSLCNINGYWPSLVRERWFLLLLWNDQHAVVLQAIAMSFCRRLWEFEMLGTIVAADITFLSPPPGGTYRADGILMLGMIYTSGMAGFCRRLGAFAMHISMVLLLMFSSPPLRGAGPMALMLGHVYI